MSIESGQIGIVYTELRGNNCDDPDQTRTESLNVSKQIGPTAAATSSPEPTVVKPARSVSNAITADMLWTHHWADQHDRCAVVGGKLVCRRCLVLYPVTLLVLLLSRIGLHWPSGFDTFLLFALPLPLVLDFVVEHMGFTRYSPKRQMVTTFLGAMALGHAFARYLEHNADPLFWTMVACYAGLCAGALAVHHLRDRNSAQQKAAEAEASDPLINGFATREAMLSYLAK